MSNQIGKFLDHKCFPKKKCKKAVKGEQFLYLKTLCVLLLCDLF